MPPLRPSPVSWLCCCFALLATQPLAGQLPPLTVPKGLFRLDLGGRLENWDQAYFGGVKRTAAGDFVRNPATGSWLPALGEVERRLQALTGGPRISLSLGQTTGHMLVNVGTESIGAAYGLTRRLTLFGTIPIVRVRVQDSIQVDSSGATAGFNPANPLFGSIDGSGRTTGFFSQLQTALASLSSQIASGTYDNDPARKALAQATLARGNSMATSLQELLVDSPFLPVVGTPGAIALAVSIDSIRTALLAVDPNLRVSNSPALPTNGIPQSALEGFATNPDGSVVAQPFQPPILRSIGDIEVGAAYLWLDHRPTRGGLAVRSVLQGTVRLRTGRLDQPDDLFDLPTGDRQPDVQGDLVTDLGAGKLGARITARYVLQLPGRQERRLTPPDQPIAAANTLAAVERDPGEILEGSVEPYLRIAPHFALVAGVRHWQKGSDKYTYVPNQDSIPGTTPDVLALGSKENGTVLTAALSFAHDGVRRDGRRGMPIDAVLRGELVVGSSQGRVPVRQSISLMLRLYRKMF